MILHEVELGDHKELYIKPISDTHIGDQGFDEQLLMKDIEWIAEKPNRYAILNGDILNTATTSSVSDTYHNNMTPHEELKYARKLFKPIADSILGVTLGNHERRVLRSDGIDLMEELAYSLDSFYNPEGILLKIKFGKRKINSKKQVYTIYQTHGSTGSRTTGGKANRLGKLRNIVLSDIYVVSHTHQKITFNKNIFVPDLRNNNIIEKNQTFVNTGAYLNYGGYGETKNYTPNDKGSPTIKLYAGEKKVEVIL